MRSALVTGATGYIGSRLVGALASANWRVHIIVRSPSLPDSLEPYLDSIIVHHHDGTIEKMLEIVANSKPSIVFHLAALTQSEHSPMDVDNLIGANILFGTQLVEAMSRNGVTDLVNTETFWQHCDGDEKYAPVSLYAATKQAFHDILHYYVGINVIKVISLMLYDTYGPKDPRKKIFSLLKQAIKDDKSIDMTPGGQIIDLTHVDDVVSGFLRAGEILLVERGCQFKVYSISSGERITLKELVEMIEIEANLIFKCVWGGRPYRRNEVMSPWIGKILPGWAPRRKMVDWIKSEFIF